MIQSQRLRGESGTPLPTVWKLLTDAGIVFRRGHLVLVAAGPGTGKSAFLLTMALKILTTGLYFSADSDAFEQLIRAICIVAHTDKETAAKAVLDNEVERYADALYGHLRFNFDPALDTVMMEDSVEAFAEVYGEYPALIVVDNLANVRMPEEDTQDMLMEYLHTMARVTGACVVVLHHVTGPHNDGDKPIPLSGVKNQITAVPEMVLTLHRPDEYTLAVSAVKNRGGRPDPSGRAFVALQFDGALMRIEG